MKRLDAVRHRRDEVGCRRPPSTGSRGGRRPRRQPDAHPHRHGQDIRHPRRDHGSPGRACSAVTSRRRRSESRLEARWTSASRSSPPTVHPRRPASPPRPRPVASSRSGSPSTPTSRPAGAHRPRRRAAARALPAHPRPVRRHRQRRHRHASLRARDGHLPRRPARSDHHRQGGRVGRLRVGRPVPVRHRRRVERRRDGAPRRRSQAPAGARARERARHEGAVDAGRGVVRRGVGVVLAELVVAQAGPAVRTRRSSWAARPGRRCSPTSSSTATAGCPSTGAVTPSAGSPSCGPAPRRPGATRASSSSASSAPSREPVVAEDYAVPASAASSSAFRRTGRGRVLAASIAARPRRQVRLTSCVR